MTSFIDLGIAYYNKVEYDTKIPHHLFDILKVSTGAFVLLAGIYGKYLHTRYSARKEYKYWDNLFEQSIKTDIAPSVSFKQSIIPEKASV